MLDVFFERGICPFSPMEDQRRKAKTLSRMSLEVGLEIQ